MAPIPFPLGSHPGRRGHESAGRLVNAFAEPLGVGAPGAAVLKRTPGLVQFSAALTDQATVLTGYRGSILSGNNLFAAFEDMLVHITSDGTVTEVGALSGSDRVQFSRNNKSPVPDVVVTTALASYVVTTTTITEISDADLPASVSNCFQDGYTFFLSAGRQIYASALNDATSINALDNVVAEARSGIGRRIVSFSQYLIAFCDKWAEVYSNTGNAVGFPFTRIAVIDRGLAGAHAICGFEDGFKKALVWVGDDNAIHTLSGFQPVRISTPDIDRDIEALTDKTTLEAAAYIVGGHAFVSFTCADWTWEYNLTTQEWHERRSYEQARWRGKGNTAFAFGKWLIGDALSGRMLEISEAARTEVDEHLIWTVESAPAQQFPRGLAVRRADFNFDPGSGIATGTDPMQTDPVVMVSWSDDGGLSWGNPLHRPIGRQAKNPAVRINRTGRTGTQGRRWRLEVSDAVYVGLMGGDMEVEARK